MQHSLPTTLVIAASMGRVIGWGAQPARGVTSITPIAPKAAAPLLVHQLAMGCVFDTHVGCLCLFHACPVAFPMRVFTGTGGGGRTGGGGGGGGGGNSRGRESSRCSTGGGHRRRRREKGRQRGRGASGGGSGGRVLGFHPLRAVRHILIRPVAEGRFFFLQGVLQHALLLMGNDNQLLFGCQRWSAGASFLLTLLSCFFFGNVRITFGSLTFLFNIFLLLSFFGGEDLTIFRNLSVTPFYSDIIFFSFLNWFLLKFCFLLIFIMGSIRYITIF